ncbi:hypothetical protein WNY37_07245 [Henriciella sp. AS95]|uniref:hypothetical protein n=1 Tax=Henriciella sp. AS95 TaxID=3135782 RepID=UPI003179DDAE
MTIAVRTIMIAWVLALAAMASHPAHAQSDDKEVSVERSRVEQLVEAHTANDRLQTERSEWEPEVEEFEPRKRNAFLDAIADFFGWLFRIIGPLLKYLMIAVIVGAILYALWYMFGDAAGLRFNRKKAKDGPDVSEIDDQRPTQTQAVALLDEADALARQGRFAEAVHLLLFRSIDDLQKKRSGGVPASLTAREIQSLSDLSQAARRALSPIIRIVETSFFGGRPVDESGWKQARQSYEDFAFGEATA